MSWGIRKTGAVAEVRKAFADEAAHVIGQWKATPYPGSDEHVKVLTTHAAAVDMLLDNASAPCAHIESFGHLNGDGTGDAKLDIVFSLQPIAAHA